MEFPLIQRFHSRICTKCMYSGIHSVYYQTFLQAQPLYAHIKVQLWKTSYMIIHAAYTYTHI